MKNIFLIILFSILSASVSNAGVESFIIHRVDGSISVTCYSSLDPFTIMRELKMDKKDITFLKNVSLPIWVTFNGKNIGSIISEDKRIKGINVKQEEREKILKFRDFLETGINESSKE